MKAKNIIETMNNPNEEEFEDYKKELNENISKPSFLGEELNPVIQDDNDELKLTKEFIKQLFNEDSLSMITDIRNDSEVLLHARLKTFAKYFDIPELDDLLKDIWRIKLSKKRLSRAEIIQCITKTSQSNENQKQGVLSKILGQRF